METEREAGGDGAEQPTFRIAGAAQEWRVHITWADRTLGPTIAFVSREDAETWISRDAADWLARLAATQPSEA